MESKEIIISGHVQGVGYRFSCKRMAQVFGVKGYVKNLPDGNVYILAKGNTTQLNLFINWCHTGPANARVSNVSIKCISNKDLKTFEIKGW